jgi:hypothetical protein
VWRKRYTAKRSREPISSEMERITMPAFSPLVFLPGFIAGVFYECGIKNQGEVMSDNYNSRPTTIRIPD